MLKVCDHCGKDYETRSKSPGRERFCGKKCNRDWWNVEWRRRNPYQKRRSEEQLRATCEVCQKDFVCDPNHPNARTCSQPCSDQRFNRIRREATAAKDVERYCPECGEKFSPGKHSRHSQVFCSTQCAGRVKGRALREKYPGKDRARQREKRCGGNFLKALERDKYRCVMCESKDEKRLVVHHIDGFGEESAIPNNDLQNLATLCQNCHRQIHNFRFRIIDGELLISGAVFDWQNITRIRIVKDEVADG